jgi:hypothetical protein
MNSHHGHDYRMARSQVRQAGPRVRDDSPSLPSPKTPNFSFSARLARSADAALPRPIFLDDDSNGPSDDGATHEHDDSGYMPNATHQGVSAQQLPPPRRLSSLRHLFSEDRLLSLMRNCTSQSPKRHGLQSQCASNATVLEPNGHA